MPAGEFEGLAAIWLEKAKEDLQCARHDFDGQFYTQVCFGCQQAVEKALKAYLFSRHVELIRTHILPRLLARCVDFDQDFRQMETACDLLTDYYIDTRYPEIGVSYTKDMAKEATELAGDILGFVGARIGEDG
jgi:HEPN domain-containing protein